MKEERQGIENMGSKGIEREGKKLLYKKNNGIEWISRVPTWWCYPLMLQWTHSLNWTMIITYLSLFSWCPCLLSVWQRYFQSNWEDVCLPPGYSLIFWKLTLLGLYRKDNQPRSFTLCVHFSASSNYQVGSRYVHKPYILAGAFNIQWRFKTTARLAQSVERETLNLKVVGSTPTSGSIPDVPGSRTTSSLFLFFLSVSVGV